MTAFLVLLGVLVTVFGVRELPLLRQKHAVARKKTLLEFASRFLHDWIEPWRNYNFTLVFLTRASLMLGLSLFMTYMSDIPLPFGLENAILVPSGDQDG